MRKCKICGKEFSSSVYKLHYAWCKENNKKVEEVEKVEKVELSDYTVKELKEICKEKGITGYSRMKEAELIEVIEGV